MPTPGTAPSSAAADAIRLDAVTFAYGRVPAVRDVSLTVPAGAFLTILGPSGCGKTTLLQLLGGYLQPAAGRVHLRGRDVTADRPERRNVGTVFQSYALFPHLTARRNVAFGLEVRGRSRDEVTARVEQMFEQVRLESAERGRYPAQLSGGQQQRVALARALAFAPDVLLLDEPLANLDRHLRDRMRAELRRLHTATGVTTVMVTHDQDEAMAASDLIGLMAGGRLLQVGPPREVYERPNSVGVAERLGEANLIDGGLVGRTPGRLVLVRPERCVLNEPAEHSWTGLVTAVTYTGADVVVRVQCRDLTPPAPLPSQGRGEMPAPPSLGGKGAGGLGSSIHPPELLVRTRSTPLAVGQSVTVGVPDSAVWEFPTP